MKASIWNILTILLSVGVVIMVIIFGVIFLMPNQVLPVAMRPVSLPPTLALPTATETPLVYFPPTWTKTPLPTTAAPTATKTYTLTVAAFPTETPSLVLSQTETTTSTATPTATKPARNQVSSLLSMEQHERQLNEYRKTDQDTNPKANHHTWRSTSFCCR